MKLMPSAVFVGLLVLGSAISGPTAASTFGQPVIIAGTNTTGSVLDFFRFGAPSHTGQLSVSGTIDQTHGISGLNGLNLAFSTVASELGAVATLTLGTTAVTWELGSGAGAVFSPDASLPGGGSYNFDLFIAPPYVETSPGVFSYLGDFINFPTRTAAFPEFEVLVSILLNAPPPTKLFEETDPVTGEVVFSDTYIEGPLSIKSITLSYAGGRPVPAVPLPATLPLLAGALGFVAFTRRKRQVDLRA